jgi:hypothetical protein
MLDRTEPRLRTDPRGNSADSDAALRVSPLERLLDHIRYTYYPKLLGKAIFSLPSSRVLQILEEERISQHRGECPL